MVRRASNGILGIALCATMLVAACADRRPPVQITQHTDTAWITGIASWRGALYCATQGGLVRWDIAAKTPTRITTADGLPSTILTDVIVDGDSTLWVASHEGLASFDGSTWHLYGPSNGLPTPFVNDLARDGEGRLWIGTDRGVFFCENGRFRALTEEGSPVGMSIRCLFFDRGGNLFIGEERALYSRKEGVWSTSQMVVSEIAQTWDLRMWATTDGGVRYWDGMAWQQYPTELAFNTSSIYGVVSGADFTWFFAPSGIFALRGQEEIAHYTTADGLLNHHVTVSYALSPDTLCIGTVEGLSIFAGGKFENYIIPFQPAGYNAISLAADARGRVWLGTWETGVSVFEENVWAPLTGGSLSMLETVRSMAFDAQGGTVFNTTGGAVFYRDGVWDAQGRDNGLSGNDIRCGLYDRKGRYWVGTATGISRRDGVVWKRYRGIHGLPSEDVWSCAMDSSGTVWFGTSRGIVSFAGDEPLDRTPETGADSLDVRAVHAIGGKVYFGTADGKLVVFDGARWDTFGKRFLKSDAAIYAIISDPQGVLWLGTNGSGVIRVEGRRVSSYTRRDGLPFDVVRGLLWHDGALWAACYGGVAVLTPQGTD